jgi:hypothetical protein
MTRIQFEFLLTECRRRGMIHRRYDHRPQSASVEVARILRDFGLDAAFEIGGVLIENAVLPDRAYANLRLNGKWRVGAELTPIW